MINISLSQFNRFQLLSIGLNWFKLFFLIGFNWFQLVSPGRVSSAWSKMDKLCQIPNTRWDDFIFSRELKLVKDDFCHTSIFFDTLVQGCEIECAEDEVRIFQKNYICMYILYIYVHTHIFQNDYNTHVNTGCFF